MIRTTLMLLLCGLLANCNLRSTIGPSLQGENTERYA